MMILQVGAQKSDKQSDWTKAASDKWDNRKRDIESKIKQCIGVAPDFAKTYDKENKNPFCPRLINISIRGNGTNSVDLGGYDGMHLESLTIDEKKIGLTATLTFKWKDEKNPQKENVETIIKKEDGTFEYNTLRGSGAFRVEKGNILFVK